MAPEEKFIALLPENSYCEVAESNVDANDIVC